MRADLFLVPTRLFGSCTYPLEDPQNHSAQFVGIERSVEGCRLSCLISAGEMSQQTPQRLGGRDANATVGAFEFDGSDPWRPVLVRPDGQSPDAVRRRSCLSGDTERSAPASANHSQMPVVAQCPMTQNPKRGCQRLRGQAIRACDANDFFEQSAGAGQ